MKTITHPLTTKLAIKYSRTKNCNCSHVVMKHLIFSIFFTTVLSLPATLAFAHEGHHHAHKKVIKSGKYGGVLTKVIEEKTQKDLYIAEFVKTDGNQVFIYLYDSNMNPVKLDGFSDAKGHIETGRGKKTKKIPLSLNKDKVSYRGEFPKIRKRPFKIVMSFKKSDKSLSMVFDNLD